MPLDIPQDVSEHLKRQLTRIQDQIVILIKNHKFLREKLQKSPQDAAIKSRIAAVEQHLRRFNSEQEPILAEIRREVGQLKKRGVLAKDRYLPPSACKNGKHSANNNNNNQQPNNTSTTQSNSADAAREAIRQRMALVREKKKTKKAGGVSKTRTPSPEESAAEDDYFEDTSIPEGQYKGHVSEVDKLSVESVADDGCGGGGENKYPLAAKSKDGKRNFMLNLDLLTDGDSRSLISYLGGLKERKRRFRDLTYVPEAPAEKKQRANYAWLSADGGGNGNVSNSSSSSTHQSGPMLRARRHQDHRHHHHRRRHHHRAQTSMRQKDEMVEMKEDSEDDYSSGEDDSVSSRSPIPAELDALEDEIVPEESKELKMRLEELKAELNSHFTVATRKERNRRNELVQEKEEIELKLKSLF